MNDKSQDKSAPVRSSGAVKKKRKNRGNGIVPFKDMTAEEQRLHRNAEILRMMPDNIADALAKARNKPVWCSDVRWRMELGRRKMYKGGF